MPTVLLTSNSLPFPPRNSPNPKSRNPHTVVNTFRRRDVLDSVACAALAVEGGWALDSEVRVWGLELHVERSCGRCECGEI
jgi:hypothetical protein